MTKDFRGFTAVNSVNLEVADNTIHALVGPNGAGKTTLFNLLTGFLQPTSGQILLRGDDIAGKQPEQIAHMGVARSFQITSLFDEMTLVEHLELALASPTGLGYKFWSSRKRLGAFRERSMELLSEVGLADRSGQRAGSLAYGQKRALEIALALANNPSLLLLDEPTAGMGIEDVDRTIELVKKVSPGRAVVFVDHNMHVVGSLADSVTVLQSGEVLAEGTYDQVRNDERVITAYLGETGDTHE
ncbi:amino acid ABC transporter ATP-binding protein [Knoellia sinensis KCTC 19936]|uniref:Amino acid ABC transporter ATP-binding protein n=1 Tax=Knoellia sinensis KCTC 19936 TaxID=1385520 RepID=A0A0A0J795_9MICO|nr:amino acid ABC transporter ATP-binding protein [Knoellia sinensis KCTC 19936]